MLKTAQMGFNSLHEGYHKRAMNIYLIQPKMNKRPMDTDLKTKMAPSLALLTLKKLTPPEHSVCIINENVEKIDFGQEVDLVGITVTVDVMNRAREIAAAFREKGVPVVAGGIHVTAVPDDCRDYFDAICVGYAERVWKQIVADSEQGKLMRVYEDMAGFSGREICGPDYTDNEGNKYLYKNVISTSRGCPHRCDFCYNSCANRNYVNRNINDILDEIAALNTRHIMFIDDNFTGNPTWTREFLLSIKDLNIKWNAAVTASIADQLELLDLMAVTGCQSLFIGFESINSSSLRSVHKYHALAKYEKLINEIHQRGIMVNASMVFGLEDDESDVFPRTLKWLVDNKVETLTAHILTPYPGTALYNRMKADGQIIDNDLSHYNTARVVFSPAKLTADELIAGYLGIYKDFYSFKNIIKRMPDNRKQWKAYLLFNLLYRKFGNVSAFLTRIIPINLIGKWGSWMSYLVK